MNKFRKLKRILSMTGIIICSLLLIHINLPWIKGYFQPNYPMIVNKANGNSAAIREMMKIKDFSAKYGNSLINSVEEVIGVPLRTEDMTFEEIQKSGWIDTEKYSPDDELGFVPPVPKFSMYDIVYDLKPKIMRKYLALDKRKYENYSVVILTPIHNSENDLVQYAQLISELNYPKHKLSIVFGEDGSEDQTFKVGKDILKEFHKQGFRRAEIFHFNISGQITGDWNSIHDQVLQHKRRKHLAKARNLLLKAGLKDEDYVLWIDADVGVLPPDLIQQLIYANKDVVAPCCLYRKGHYTNVYDKNTWRETEYSLEAQKNLSKTQLVLEGYGPTIRLYLPHLRGEGRVVPLDGVGGCSLLIKAKCHRKGLNFPEEIFQNHIETEGLAKLAKSLGFGVYGMPFVEVYHK
ncbi:uncharacterized protein LOC134240860 [Saccostrea cucullata]|uniref:uncharacterized protein LOC134240860 n=1 Tax=Saccostrea cuccullata TaxID=36930 RepID=UPI002ED383FC